MENLLFSKPNVAYEENKTDPSKAKFVMEPLEKGFADTIGNSLRRVMRSSMPGTSIIGVEVKGINHEFALIPGSATDMTELIQSLKRVILRIDVDTDGVLTASYKGKKAGVITAGEFTFPEGVKVLNPEQELFIGLGEMETNVTLYYKKGRGYKESNQHEELKEIGEGKDILGVDGLFSPIRTIRYEKKNIRHEEKSGYESLTIHVETNGTVTAKNAILIAQKILNEHYNVYENMSELVDMTRVHQEKREKENRVLDYTIENLELSVRSYNGLNRAGYTTVRQIITLTKDELKTFEKMGTKSVNEIEEKIRELGLELRKM